MNIVGKIRPVGLSSGAIRQLPISARPSTCSSIEQ
jgi:hypothetical protein